MLRHARYCGLMLVAWVQSSQVIKDKRVYDWLVLRKLEPISAQPQPSHIVSSCLSQWSYVKFYYIKSYRSASAGRRRASHSHSFGESH
ncbi:hypothetical protein QQF64_001305 [Cirrhinus molitorella]|uniref:Secreted protein n=1 Tax=Cirrhinus molitorella TaxID=172907 RepID=A0ABR3P062_9TELE